MHKIYVIINPAIGTITVSDNTRIILKIFAFQLAGVCPTSAAIVPTLAFTSPNILAKFDWIAPINIPRIQSVIAFSMPDIHLLLFHFLDLSQAKKRCKNMKNINEL
jgi:hypothetical protein